MRVAFRQTTFVEVWGGAGDDQIIVNGARAFGEGGGLYGGSGDDTVVGGGGEELLAGGRGHDVLRGRGGGDALDGGAGSDVMQGGPGADDLAAAGGNPLEDADLLDGGGGPDALSYQGTPAPVKVDLSDPAPDGRPGETDRLLAIENVSGGEGSNVLVGDDRDNELSGSMDPSASDQLDGRGGDDFLEGDGGPNELYGGEGNDELEDPTAHASCGPGNDVLSSTRLMPRVDADCERAQVLLGPDVSLALLKTDGSSVPIRFFPRDAGRIRVVVSQIEAPKAVLAQGVVRLPSRRRAGGGAKSRAIALTPEGDAQLQGQPSIPVVIALWRTGWRDSTTSFHNALARRQGGISLQSGGIVPAFGVLSKEATEARGL